MSENVPSPPPENSAPVATETSNATATPETNSTAAPTLALNPFQAAQDAQSGTDHAEGETGDKGINLTDCEFDAPVDFDAAKSQNGRMKKYIEELKSHIQDNQTSLPEKYELQLNKDLEQGEMAISAEDPMLTSFEALAKEANLTQDQFNAVTNFYLTQEMGAQNALITDSNEHVQNVLSELGNTPEEGMARLRSLTSRFAEAGLGEGTINALQECLAIDAEAIKGMEALLKNQNYSHPEKNSLLKPSLQKEHADLKKELAKGDHRDNPALRGKLINRLGEIHQQAIKEGVQLPRSY